jgi:hypothetical protein
LRRHVNGALVLLVDYVQIPGMFNNKPWRMAGTGLGYLRQEINQLKEQAANPGNL